MWLASRRVRLPAKTGDAIRRRADAWRYSAATSSGIQLRFSPA